MRTGETGVENDILMSILRCAFKRGLAYAKMRQVRRAQGVGLFRSDLPGNAIASLRFLLRGINFESRLR
jgi:hypothetical protein